MNKKDEYISFMFDSIAHSNESELDEWQVTLTAAITVIEYLKDKRDEV